ncbi:MAG: chemotaxis protein CheW [Gammaproteobacteria bacterium]|nr:chemotaxis protein CheW [Gammaproteobacteria bacterium]
MSAAELQHGQLSAENRRELLTFRLGEEEYGIDILSVQEIRRYEAVTRIANTPEFIKGVINMRGTIVPIVDLRIRFALGNVTYDEFTVVVILNVADRVVGIVVDAVSDVIAIDAEALRPAPEFGAHLDTDYLDGLATVDERMVIIVDIEALITTPELGLIDDASSAA